MLLAADWDYVSKNGQADACIMRGATMCHAAQRSLHCVLQSKGHLGSTIAQNVDHMLRHKNPFVDHCSDRDKDTSLLAFELEWADIVGIDYRWQLVQDARLVLEAKTIVKRVFQTVRSIAAACLRALVRASRIQMCTQYVG